MAEKRELTEQEMEIIDKLMLRDLLEGFEETIADNYSVQDIKLWRMVHSPMEERDMLPQDLQEFDSLADALAKYETPSVEDLSEEEKADVVFGLSLSFNDELEPLAKKMTGFYDAKKTDASKAKFLERLGTKFVRYHLPEGAAMVQNEADDDSHRNVFLNKGVNLDELKIDEKDFFEYKDGDNGQD